MPRVSPAPFRRGNGLARVPSRDAGLATAGPRDTRGGLGQRGRGTVRETKPPGRRRSLQDRLRRPRRVWLSRALWRQRVTFWAGGLAVGVVAIAFAKAADLAYALLRAGV